MFKVSFPLHRTAFERLTLDCVCFARVVHGRSVTGGGGLCCCQGNIKDLDDVWKKWKGKVRHGL